MDKKSLIVGIIIGLVSIIAITCLVVLIGCAVNGLSFSEQIVEWFSKSKPVLDTIPEEIDTLTNLFI